MIPISASHPSSASSLALTTNMVSESTRRSLPVLRAADFAALSTTQISAFANSRQNTDGVAALSTTQISAFANSRQNTDGVAALSTTQISAFANSRQNTDGVAALSTTQISAFANSRQNTDGVAALSTTQISAFANSRQNTDGLAALSTSQISAFDNSMQNTDGLTTLSASQISAFGDSTEPTLSRASVMRANVNTLAQAIGSFAETDAFATATGKLDLAFGKNTTLSLAGAISISHLTQVLQQFDQQGQLLRATGLAGVDNSANSLLGLTQRDTLGILGISK